MESGLPAKDSALASELALTVVLPTFNEAENLPAMAAALSALPLPNFQLLVVDDNSPDGTGKIADQLAAQYNHAQDDTLMAPPKRPRIQVMHRSGKAGLGTAYVAGIRRALADGADFIVQMDADFSHSPAYIVQMLGVMLVTDTDVVIGSRYVPGGTLDEGWGWGRRFLSWWANLYSRMILGLRIRDMTAGFKLWKRAALLGIGLHTVRSNGYTFQVEMAYLCERLGYRLIEIPIHFEDRRIGHSKMDIPVKLNRPGAPGRFVGAIKRQQTTEPNSPLEFIYDLRFAIYEVLRYRRTSRNLLIAIENRKSL